MKLSKVKQGLGVVFFLGAGVIVLNIGMVRGDLSIGTYFDLKKNRDVLQETVKELEKENEQLNTEIIRLKASPDYAKKVLRDKYHITDPDEDIIFFAD